MEWGQDIHTPFKMKFFNEGTKLQKPTDAFGVRPENKLLTSRNKLRELFDTPTTEIHLFNLREVKHLFNLGKCSTSLALIITAQFVIDKPIEKWVQRWDSDPRRTTYEDAELPLLYSAIYGQFCRLLRFALNRNHCRRQFNRKGFSFLPIKPNGSFAPFKSNGLPFPIKVKLRTLGVEPSVTWV